MQRSRRTRVVDSIPNGKRLNAAKAVQEILNSSVSLSGHDSRLQTESGSQQLSPLPALLSSFLSYQRENRPNPLSLQRGSNVLCTFQTLIPTLTSATAASTLIYVPQGVHPTTGQALPPSYNNPARFATGEDTAAFSNTLSNTLFAFQVINNNYSIHTAQPGHLNLQRKDSMGSENANAASTKRIMDQERSVSGIRPPKRRKQTQVTFVPDTTARPLRIVNIPKSARSVKELIRWWVTSDLSINLPKPLKDWTAEERNSTYIHNGKEKSNRSRFAKLKTHYLVFFHFCENNSVIDYEAAFTSLSATNRIGKNYAKSSEYSRNNNLAIIFKEQKDWLHLTDKVLRRADVQAVLGL